jgi:hypothetical protein
LSLHRWRRCSLPNTTHLRPSRGVQHILTYKGDEGGAKGGLQNSPMGSARETPSFLVGVLPQREHAAWYLRQAATLPRVIGALRSQICEGRELKLPPEFAIGLFCFPPIESALFFWPTVIWGERTTRNPMAQTPGAAGRRARSRRDPPQEAKTQKNDRKPAPRNQESRGRNYRIGRQPPQRLPGLQACEYRNTLETPMHAQCFDLL